MNGEVGIGGGNGTISLVEGIGVALRYFKLYGLYIWYEYSLILGLGKGKQ